MQFCFQHDSTAKQKDYLFIPLQALFQIFFRRLILINGVFNVIFPLNIHLNVAATL